MCTKVLSCILCGQPNFPNVDALRVSLLKVTARPLKCPICGDELLGLDKLTIHLFGHSLLEDHQGAPNRQEVADEGNSIKSDSIRNDTSGSKAEGSSKSLRKVRRREPSSEAEVKRSENGTDIGLGKMSPAGGPLGGSNYCSMCDVEFRNPALLKMHQEVFHENGAAATSPARLGGGDKRFVCHICPKEFKMKGSLKIHMRVVHADGPKKLCLEGTHRANITHGRSSTTTTAVEAAPRNNDVMAKNDQLIPSPMSLQMLDQHQNIAIFHPPAASADGIGVPPPEPHIIQIIDPRQLAQVVYLPPNSSGTPSVDSGNIVGAQQFIQEATNASPRRIDSPSLPSSPQQPGQTDNPKQWECDVCRKTFTTKYFLKKHNRLHTGEMPYTCGICNKSFTFQQSYHKHLLYHSDEKPHVCSVCNRAFKELSTLHNHERIHSGEKPFACETCGKCFRQRVSYLVHRRIHTGLMPYKCSGCEKSFRYKVSQRTHKCPASPPGTVVRKTGDLLQKLLQSSSILPEGSSHPDTGNLFPVSPMEESNKQEVDYVNRTLDELVQGTYNKLGNIAGTCDSSATLYDHQTQQQPIYSISINEAQFKQPHPAQLEQVPAASNSPMDGSFPRIENLCLLSPSAFDSGQLEDLEGLKLDNGW
ncbi:zinc finger protein Xfin [Anopheles ziemanni]|uniref:zinc finger protein Xfin n=1 Tax=Anopheles coustani TaxID=139045 RepID=UPI00265B404F|nr:zinc finger protein Xfin [Anopheles coustani]XP_058173887.1 zinc finger protein Xfin [Anopheles ziemanni]